MSAQPENFDLDVNEQAEPLPAENVARVFESREDTPDDAVTLDEPAGEVQVSEAQAEAPQELEPEKEISPASQRIQQEIIRRKQIELERDQLLEQTRQAQTRHEQIMAMLDQQQQAAEPAVPEFDEDPASHLLAQQRQLENQVRQQQEFLAQQHHQQQAAQQFAQLQTALQTQEQQLSAQHPDYFDRIEGLKNSRLEMWQRLGHSAQDAAMRVQQEAVEVAAAAMRNGGNAAEEFYRLAQSQAPAPQQSAPQQVAREAQNRQRASSLGSRNASGRTSVPTYAELAEMDDAEFDKWTSGDALRKLHGER